MTWEKFKYAEIDTVLPAKILVVDELAQFLEGVDRKDMRLADKLQENFASIARLGRSAHVHIVLATQSASGNLFPSSLKNNISTRFICGRVEANISRMAIDSEEGESLPLTPGSYLGYSKGETLQFQGYYTPTPTVLSLGTVKPGYDKKTGLPIETEDDMAPVEDFSDDEQVSEPDSNVVFDENDTPIEVRETDDINSLTSFNRKDHISSNTSSTINTNVISDNSDDIELSSEFDTFLDNEKNGIDIFSDDPLGIDNDDSIDELPSIDELEHQSAPHKSIKVSKSSSVKISHKSSEEPAASSTKSSNRSNNIHISSHNIKINTKKRQSGSITIE